MPVWLFTSNLSPRRFVSRREQLSTEEKNREKEKRRMKRYEFEVKNEDGERDEEVGDKDAGRRR